VCESVRKKERVVRPKEKRIKKGRERKKGKKKVNIVKDRIVSLDR